MQIFKPRFIYINLPVNDFSINTRQAENYGLYRPDVKLVLRRVRIYGYSPGRGCIIGYVYIIDAVT